MGKLQIISIISKDGTTVSYKKPYNYFEKANITDSIENSKDDDIVTFRSQSGDEILIPKKNISFVKIELYDPDEDDEEVI